MNKKTNKLNRSDIEAYIQTQLPDISNNQIKLSIDLIINQIVEAVAMDEKVEIRGFGTFSKKYEDPENLLILRQKRFLTLEKQKLFISNHQKNLQRYYE